MGEKCNQKSMFDVYLTLKRLLISYFWVFALGFTILTTTGTIPPYKRSFHCNDPNINKPFTGDTITPLMLFLVLMLAPPIVFFLTEFYCFAEAALRDTSGRLPDKRKFGKVLYAFLQGFTYVGAVTELLKVSVSELRPHFLHSCQPDVHCYDGVVESYNCTATEGPWWLRLDIYKSFPSGHTSMSVYVFFFVYLYTQRHLRRSSIFRIFIQVLFLGWALTCAITRVTDHRHFWWDVLAGGLLGIIGGILTEMCRLRSNDTS